MPEELFKKLGVVRIDKEDCEGHAYKPIITDKVAEPVIAITGYYETVRNGWLEYCKPILPKKTKIIKRSGASKEVYYMPDLKKKLIVYYGDAETTSLVEILEMTEDDCEYIQQLQEMEKILEADD